MNDNTVTPPADDTALAPALDGITFLRAGWLVLIAGFIGFLLWAALAPLDQGVSVSGQVIVEGQRKTLHHLTGAQVEKILVSEGQTVSAGQLLIQMNDIQVRSQLESLRFQRDSAMALLARLQAERDGLDEITFPPDWQPAGDIIRTQQSLLTSRRHNLHHALAMQDEIMAGYRHQLQAAQDSLHNRKKQITALDEQLGGIRTLVSKGHLPRTQQLDMERLYAQVDATVSEDIGRIGQLQRQIQESRLRQQAIREQFQEDIHRQLAETELRVQALNEHYQAAQHELENTRIVAPVDGVVTGLSVFTEGGFVAREAHLMDIVPLQHQLLVEGQVPVHLIDAITPGLEVNLVFSAFNQAITPQVPAEVATVSADRLIDPQTGLPFYRVQARVTPEGMQALTHHQVRPGMPVELFVRTGERSLLSYLFKPLRDRARSALGEA